MRSDLPPHADGPVLETERLVLRPPGAQDLDAFVQFASDPVTMEHLGGVQARSQVWRAVMSMAGAWHLQGYAMFSVIEKASGRWIGRLGPWMPADWPGTEVGWGLLREFEGRGYACEGAAAAMDWAFEALGWSEIIHTIGPDNVGSRKLAQRLGATLRGPGRLPAPYQEFPIEIWGQTKAEWAVSRTRLRPATHGG